MVTFKLPTGLFRFSAPDTLPSGDLPKHPLLVTDGFIAEGGFSLSSPSAGGWFTYLPDHFERWLDYMDRFGVSRSVLFAADFLKSAVALGLFKRWALTETANEFERDIRAGSLTFEEARDICPDVFKVASFQQFHSLRYAAYQMPQRKKGKRPRYCPREEALYALACRIYKENHDSSWEGACYAATVQRPDLVPEKWRKDPDGNLKRAAARKWDKSVYSQLSYRQSRDK